MGARQRTSCWGIARFRSWASSGSACSLAVSISAADERPGVAAFDLDGTLTRRDTLLPFLQRLCGTTAVMRALMPEWSAVPAAALGTIDRDATKARVLARLLAGWVATDVVDAAEDYAENVVTARDRKSTRLNSSH